RCEPREPVLRVHPGWWCGTRKLEVSRARWRAAGEHASAHGSRLQLLRGFSPNDSAHRSPHPQAADRSGRLRQALNGEEMAKSKSRSTAISRGPSGRFVLWMFAGLGVL